jgi:hypothetical protein
VTAARQLSLVPSGGAEFSSCDTYRYLLWRAWRPGARTLFIMLNPSTATETVDDPTIRRCIGFARSWGFDGLEVCNLFALRSTDPNALLRHLEPIGPLNDETIAGAPRRAGRVVCAWGSHRAMTARGPSVLRRLWDAGIAPWVLALTPGLGRPAHPLYLRKDLQPFRLLPEPP